MNVIEKARESLKRQIGRSHNALHLGAEISASVSGGVIELEVISAIEDLKEDANYFIVRARAEQNLPQHKRFVRAGFLTLNAYIEASINQLYEAILLDAEVSRSEVGRRL